MSKVMEISEISPLNSVEEYELNQWLIQNNINPLKLRRTFTDVLPLARVLTRYYPQLIDVNYYPPRNSIKNKLQNWDLFSERVLSKMGVHMTRDEKERVVRGVPGSIEMLLFTIMNASTQKKQTPIDF